MNIKIKNIGIINESTVALDGLTVITGKNNSGKTTVGKVIYSLIDAVSNQRGKYQIDRYHYINKTLSSIADKFDVFRYFCYEDKNNQIKKIYPALFQLFDMSYSSDTREIDIEKYARDIQNELNHLDVNDLIKKKEYQIVKAFFEDRRHAKFDQIITEQKEEVKHILEQMFIDINIDRELVNYSRESINQTLNLEFQGQIQPVKKVSESDSEIIVFDDGVQYFRITISNNTILNDGKPVFFSSPIKKIYFIDDPFVIDGNIGRSISRQIYEREEDSILDLSRIRTHKEKLTRALRGQGIASALEKTVLEDKLKTIKDKINNVVPGSFEFSSKADYYVHDKVKLKLQNQATGSKMFSIIKILLENGELDDTTLLILDEPEAHLHPQWQNDFAEIIILLIKELNVKVLLTSHSSNFVLAVDAFVRKNEIEKVTNFYQTKKNENGMVDYINVNNDIGVIYQDFLDYLSQVKTLRDKYLKPYEDE